MFELILATVLLCPTMLTAPGPTGNLVTATVYYDHEAPDGQAYRYIAGVLYTEPGTYTVEAEGHPIGVQWNAGEYEFCGRLPGLVFRDGFETSNTQKWDNSGGLDEVKSRNDREAIRELSMVARLSILARALRYW
jgi:hypothetical protein